MRMGYGNGALANDESDADAGVSERKDREMLDLVMLAIAAAFFILSVAYAYACDRL
jgi:hypothetical protein